MYTTSTQTWGYVEVYGSRTYAVLVANAVHTRFSVPYVWGQNPTTGASTEGSAPDMPIPTPSSTSQVPTAGDHRDLLTTMHRLAADIEFENIINEEIAIAFAELGDGDPSDPLFLGEVSRRISIRWSALERGSPVDLARPIESKDALDRVVQAMRALPERSRRRR